MNRTADTIGSNQVTTQRLFTLNGLKQGLKVAGAEPREVMSLNDLNENGGTVHQMLSRCIST